ncbi:MAG: FkbM family methyltransferase [Thiotrichales bacterium]|nr:FkbM family methyltransferase [Thiotrichales bacterium]
MKRFDRNSIRLIRSCLSLFGAGKRNRVLATIASRLAPIITIDDQGCNIKIICNSRKTLYWAKNFYTHEPETIEWIRTFSPGDVFWDVGANVGIYSLFAATRPGVRVISFEPMAENFSSLQKNIRLNNLSEVVQCYCLALSDGKSICRLDLSNDSAGSDSHVFVKSDSSPGVEQKTQTVIGMPVDEFIREFAVHFPNHLKVDVDGPEESVLHGAAITLGDTRLRSVLIEGDVAGTEKNKRLSSLLNEAGFELRSRGSTAGSNVHRNYLYTRE